MKDALKSIIIGIEQEKKLKAFLNSLGQAGRIADKVSDLIIFHNRVKENAEKILFK